MLFIESKTLSYERDMTGEMRLSVLDKLQAKELAGLIQGARRHLFDTLTGGDEGRAREIERHVIASDDAGESFVKGDLFVEDEYILYVIFGDTESESSVRAGIIYDGETTDPAQHLEGFCQNVGDALETGSEWRAGEQPASESSRSRYADSSAAPLDRTNGDESARWRAAELLQDAAARRFLRRAQEAHADNRSAELTLNAFGDEGGAGAGPTILATLAAFVVGYASIAFLLRWLTRHSTAIFVAYRVALGMLVLALAGSGVIT